MFLYYETGYDRGEYRTIIKTGPNETVVIMGIKNHTGKKNKTLSDKAVLDANLNEYSIRLRTIHEVHRVQIIRLLLIDLLYFRREKRSRARAGREVESSIPPSLDLFTVLM